MASNERNQKRILKTRAKLEEMFKYRNKPEYFLQVNGFMNEYVQSFIISHNFEFDSTTEVTEANPDNMSYEVRFGKFLATDRVGREDGQGVDRNFEGGVRDSEKNTRRRKNERVRLFDLPGIVRAETAGGVLAV